MKRAGAIGQERRRQEAEERKTAEARREREKRQRHKKHLTSLVGREEALWGRVEALITTSQPKKYDAAVEILTELPDLAASIGACDVFASRMQTLAATYHRRPSLLARFKKATLLDAKEKQ